MGFLIRLLVGIALYFIVRPRTGSPHSPISTGRHWLAWACLIVSLGIFVPHQRTEADVAAIYALMLVVFGSLSFAIGALIGWRKSRPAPGPSPLSIPKPDIAYTAALSPQPVMAEQSNSKLSANPKMQNPSPEPREVAVDEDAIYEKIAAELESGNTDKGLWIKIYSECDGDDKKTKLAYIKLRVEKLIAIERERLAEAERKRVDADREEAARLEGTRKQNATADERAAIELGIWQNAQWFCYEHHRFGTLREAVAFVTEKRAKGN